MIKNISQAARRKAKKAANVAAFKKRAKGSDTLESKIIRAIKAVARETSAKYAPVHRLFGAGKISWPQYQAGVTLAADYHGAKDTRTSSLEIGQRSGAPSFPVERLTRQVECARRLAAAVEALKRCDAEATHWVWRLCVEERHPDELLGRFERTFGDKASAREQMHDVMNSIRRGLDVLAAHYGISRTGGAGRMRAVA